MRGRSLAPWIFRGAGGWEDLGVVVDGVRLERTWDGLPVAREAPYGASVVVRREDSAYLVLHRAVNGAEYVGDWAWTPPAGSRQPGESVYAATLRELAEETGLSGYEPLPARELRLVGKGCDSDRGRGQPHMAHRSGVSNHRTRGAT